MRKAAGWTIIAAIFVIASCGSEKSSTPAPSTECASIAGTWNFHRLETGSDGSGSWAYSTETIDNDCTGTQLSFLDSNGNSSPGNPVTYSLNSNGILTRSDNSSFSGMVMRNNQMIVITRTAGSGSTYRMAIGLKSGGSFTQSDLAGVHNVHMLQSGGAPLWANGIVTIDGLGNATSTWTQSDGSAGPGVPSTQTVSSSGVITDSLNSTWHGRLSATKDIMVATATMGTSFDMIVGAPSGGTFTTADLAGTWRWHFLQTGTGHEAWVRGKLQSDSAGNVTQLAQEDSGGGNTPGDPFTWAIDANGIITRSDSPEYHGVMLSDKTTIISTKSSGDGLGYRLLVSRKD